MPSTSLALSPASRMALRTASTAIARVERLEPREYSVSPTPTMQYLSFKWLMRSPPGPPAEYTRGGSRRAGRGRGRATTASGGGPGQGSGDHVRVGRIDVARLNSTDARRPGPARRGTRRSDPYPGPPPLAVVNPLVGGRQASTSVNASTLQTAERIQAGR